MIDEIPADAEQVRPRIQIRGHTRRMAFEPGKQRRQDVSGVGHRLAKPQHLVGVPEKRRKSRLTIEIDTDRQALQAEPS